MTALYYLQDLFHEIIAEGIELKQKCSTEYDQGKLFAYYEILSLMLNQAEAFNIKKELPEDIQKFVPEVLLAPIDNKS